MNPVSTTARICKGYSSLRKRKKTMNLAYAGCLREEYLWGLRDLASHAFPHAQD